VWSLFIFDWVLLVALECRIRLHATIVETLIGGLGEVRPLDSGIYTTFGKSLWPSGKVVVDGNIEVIMPRVVVDRLQTKEAGAEEKSKCP